MVRPYFQYQRSLLRKHLSKLKFVCLMHEKKEKNMTVTAKKSTVFILL